jgi:DNA-binding MarR family transcriptional regulator/GNAT superfamily N-acetyltransferase
MRQDLITDVRRFNRLVVQRVGALDDHFLGRDRPYGESRLLFEIGPPGADLRDLRARLGLDSGYLSRLVQALSAKGLVTVRPGPGDERVRRAELTPVGLAEYDEMERRSDGLAATILEPLTESQRDRLVAAMTEVRRLLRVAGAHIERVDPTNEQARWCVAQYFAELQRRFEHGFDPSLGLPVDDTDLLPPRGTVLLGTIDGEPVACGSIKPLAPGVGYLKRMWVSDSVRGLGFGRRMLGALEGAARELGLTMLRLETNRALAEAIHLYDTSGYRRIAPFNDEPYADHWFEKELG